MNKKLNQKKGFTLAEIMIVFFIIGIIAAVTLKPVNDNSVAHINKFMYYSAFTNLKMAVARMLYDGCTPAEYTSTLCATGQLPKQLVSGGRGFCERLAEMYNIVGNPNCSQLTSSAPFTNPTFKTSNSMKFFMNNPDANGYTIYVDIDGDRRSGKANEDVLPFFVYFDGTVLPLAGSNADDNTQYLSATVRYIDSSGNKAVLSSGSTVYSGVSYRKAICAAAQLDSTKLASYCAGYYINGNCQSENWQCRIIINKPGYMFFTR